jgi:hypothetical protein
LNYTDETPKEKRLKIAIKSTDKLYALDVDGLTITDWVDMHNIYAFKGKLWTDINTETYLFRLYKNSIKGLYYLEIMTSGGHWTHSIELVLSEIKIKRLFYKKCIELIKSTLC